MRLTRQMRAFQLGHSGREEPYETDPDKNSEDPL